MKTGDWSQEGGADAAAALLKQYNRETGRWDLPRDSEFWQACAAAHDLGRFGAGNTIAIVDDGFDMTLPALASQQLAWGLEGTGPADHGTAVALLIREVAPEARLLLYPAAVRGSWDAGLIERALREVSDTPATIVNLSLGKAFPTDVVYPVEEFLRNATPWPNMSKEDLEFWSAELLGELDGWRALLRRPACSVARAAAEVATSGRIVVAATGNSRDHVFSPAFESGVFSVAFSRVHRSIVERQENAVALPPTFSQSLFSDFSVIQPPGVLGSSFAAPLISGMAALMRSRNELSAYRELSRLAALGDALLGKLDHSVDNDWSDRRDGVIDRLYVKAINGQPHPHLHPDHQEVCPECGLFAASAYVNFGLFKLNWGDLDGAEPLLRAAGAFAPWSPHAAANMGVALALRARQAQEQNRWSDVSRLLIEAADLQQKALDLRPDSQSYRARVEEFRAGAQDPQRWIMQP